MSRQFLQDQNGGSGTVADADSAVFSVIFGWAIFRERGFKARLLGSSIMLLGVIAIAVSKTLE